MFKAYKPSAGLIYQGKVITKNMNLLTEDNQHSLILWTVNGEKKIVSEGALGMVWINS